MKHNANVQFPGALVASSASISSLNAIQGVAAGGSTVTSGTVLFSSSNNISFGQNARTITCALPASAGASGFEYPGPMMGFGAISTRAWAGGASDATGGSTQETGSIFVQPIIYPWNLKFNEVLGLISYSMSQTTGTATERVDYGIYTLNGLTQFSLVSSFRFNVYVTQNSSTALSFHWFWGTTSNTNSSASSGNLSAGHARLELIRVSNGGTYLPAGQYWLAGMYRNTTSGAVIGRHNRIGIDLFTSNAGNMGDLMAAYAVPWRFGKLPHATNNLPFHQFQGTLSTTDNGTDPQVLNLPATFDITLLTNTNGNTSASYAVNNNSCPFLSFRSS